MDNATDTDLLIPDTEESGTKRKVRFSDTFTVFREDNSVDGNFYSAKPTFISLRAIIESEDKTLRTNLNTNESCSLSAICALLLFLLLFFGIFTLFVKKLLIIEIESTAPINGITAKK